eukprot:TRINITY_DN2528_c0_g5_i1.p1 TRINITY_DN2528_c0_g5~~TRINITY_DN2528_c0_g5_i1.p1  ORF type:complete len:363 (+),score=82.00 TRINITY_DN2528_c0_g5_i1:113-1090(+)
MACADKGITLITIPYWWDGKPDSLASTLHLSLPDIFPQTGSPQIPSHPPPNAKTPFSKVMGNHVAALLMHAEDWDGEVDPTGWYMSEKVDGFRAFWDGSNLFSKKGNLLPAPLEFTSTLPRNVYLDGELWVGYDGFNKLLSIVRKSTDLQTTSDLWKDVKFCVFDAPMHHGSYPERHTYARQATAVCGPNICTIPIQPCTGVDHLNTILSDITSKKGEGVMLYHPTSTYTPGRTSNLLKVKAYTEEDVKFLKCNPNSYSFLCEQLNGATSIIKCSGWDYLNPPTPGTVLTVKHNGIFKSSQKMKYPFLTRVRPDLTWNQIKQTSL